MRYEDQYKVIGITDEEDEDEGKSIDSQMKRWMKIKGSQ
jgi:hypothetical protein